MIIVKQPRPDSSIVPAVSSRGGHENLCYFDPNENRIVNIHTKEGLETFDPVDLDDFLIQTTAHWNIATPEQKEELL